MPTGQPELDRLVNDDTVLRATATFLRTTVTRSTRFDRFLAGEDALSARQRRGAGCSPGRDNPVRVERIGDGGRGHAAEQVYRFTNTSDAVVDTHLLIVVRGLPAGTRLLNGRPTAVNLMSGSSFPMA